MTKSGGARGRRRGSAGSVFVGTHEAVRPAPSQIWAALRAKSEQGRGAVPATKGPPLINRKGPSFLCPPATVPRVYRLPDWSSRPKARKLTAETPGCEMGSVLGSNPGGVRTNQKLHPQDSLRIVRASQNPLFARSNPQGDDRTKQQTKVLSEL